MKTSVRSIFLFMLSSQVCSAETIREWQWLDSDCENCDIKLVAPFDEAQDKEVQRFIRALEDNKAEIVKLYNSDPQEYNLLAVMALGVLGNESKFFKSKKYYFKKNAPWVVTGVKKLKSVLDDRYKMSGASNGPTQIKKIPVKIAKKYGVTTETVGKWPEHAAIATIGFLIEALQELKQRAINNDLEFITPETYTDYLPYIYFGRVTELVERTATPDKNLYVQRMKHYMSLVQVLEYENIDTVSTSIKLPLPKKRPLPFWIDGFYKFEL